jgi:arsenate reductase
MKEIGIDVLQNRSRHLNEFLARKLRTVITVCSDVDTVCPTFPGTVIRYHWGFEDPAMANGTEEEVLKILRRRSR